MYTNLQAVSQPYPLYAALVEVFRHDDDAPLEFSIDVRLVIGWNHYRDVDGNALPAVPVLASATSGHLPAEYCEETDGPVRHFFAPDFHVAQAQAAAFAQQLGARPCDPARPR